jgi:EpsI family protein
MSVTSPAAPIASPQRVTTAPSPGRRAIVLSAAMAGVSALALALRPTRKMADTREQVALEAIVPPAFGAWAADPSHREAMVSPDVQENINRVYDQVLSRVYVDPQGRRMMVSIAYGSRQTQELKAHRQEVCYTAQGFSVTHVRPVDLHIAGRTIGAIAMYAAQGRRHEPVTYWFTMGDTVVLSRTGRLLTQIKYSFAGVIPDGFLVRISSLGEDDASSYQAHADFARQLIEAADEPARIRLVGRRAASPG